MYNSLSLTIIFPYIRKQTKTTRKKEFSAFVDILPYKVETSGSAVYPGIESVRLGNGDHKTFFFSQSGLATICLF